MSLNLNFVRIIFKASIQASWWALYILDEPPRLEDVFETCVVRLFPSQSRGSSDLSLLFIIDVVGDT